MSTLAQHQQAPDCNERNILNVLRMELDEKIDKFVKAQPDIGTLVEKLYTIRRDTNILLEVHSALCRGAQKKVVATEKFSEDNADETAKVEHCPPENVSRQVFTITGNELRNNHSK